MKELLRSSDVVALSWLSAFLADSGIDCEVFDAHISSSLGGQVGFPRRLMVADETMTAPSALSRQRGPPDTICEPARVGRVTVLTQGRAAPLSAVNRILARGDSRNMPVVSRVRTMMRLSEAVLVAGILASLGGSAVCWAR